MLHWIMPDNRVQDCYMEFEYANMNLLHIQQLTDIMFDIVKAVLLFAVFTGAAHAVSTADHTKFKELQKDFKSGPEVTKACLSCHSEAAAQFHKTIHWTWMDPSTEENLKLGKGGLSVNNF